MNEEIILDIFQNGVNVYITKKLQKIADDTQTNVSKVISDKILELYKVNYIASLSSRSARAEAINAYNAEAKRRDIEDKEKKLDTFRHRRKTLSYRNTKLLLRDGVLYTEIEGNFVKLKIKEDVYYETHNGLETRTRSVADVVDDLEYGTKRRRRLCVH